MTIVASNSLTVSNVNDGTITHIAYANIKFLCKENQNFTLSKTSLVRYGSDSRWVYKELQAGTYTATTTLWGQGDPAQGATKNVELVSEFSTSDYVDKTHIGVYVDFVEADSADPTKYAWSLIKGVDGKDGVAGKAGVDGKTPYFHQAWAGSEDGKVDFSATDPTNRGYLGTYTDFEQVDSKDPTKYFWVELVGALSIGGRNYLADTGSLWQAKGSGGTNQSSSTKWLFTFGTIKQAPFKDGDYVTVSFDYTSVGTGAYGTIFPQFNGTPWAKFGGGEAMHDTGHMEHTIQWKSDWTTSGDAVGIQIRLDNVATTRTVTVYNMQFERGNKATDHKSAPEDTQQQIDIINKGLADTNGKIAAVPHVSAQAAQPSNPKNGDQWWVLDAQGRATGFKVWNGSTWADNKIQQSMLNVVSLNAVTVTGSTINGSKFTNNFTNVEGSWTWNGVTTIEKGSMIIDAVRNDKIRQSMSIDSNGIIQNTFNANGSTMYATSLNMGSLSMSDATYNANLTPEVLASINSTFTEIKGVNGAAKPAYFGYSGHVCWLLINSMLPVSRTTMYWIPKKFCIRSAQIPIIHLNNGALAVYGNGNVENLSIDNDRVVQNGFITWVY